MRSFALKACVLVGVASLGSTALASTTSQSYGAKYSGVVQAGYDLTGLFGTAGANLAGDPFTETFTISVPSAYPAVTTSDPNGSETQFGGSSMGRPELIDATLTINGHSQTVDGTYMGVARTGYDTSDGLYELFDSATAQNTTGSQAISDTIAGGVRTSSPGVVPTTFGGYDLKVGGAVQSYNSGFQFQTTSNGVPSIDTYGVLTVASATPEASTWVLLMIGLGGVGLAMRLARAEKRLALSSVEL